MLLEGTQISHYRLLRRIGGGGMGDVYLAENMHIHRQVAIKVIKPNITSNPDAVRLFLREAKAVATLDHPHILPLFDFGEANIGDGIHPYIVMPLRQEGSLATWLRQDGNAEKLSLQTIAGIVHQAADALQHAHDRQIIHLDVKPSNFLIRNNSGNSEVPDLLLTDFGLAKVLNTEVSVSQSSRGTPTYMAPEQWKGKPVSVTDEYALAVMTYEMLVGRPPFRGNLEQMMYQHLEVQPQPPSTLNPHLSKDIDSVILHGLAKKTEDRFRSISGFDRAFQQAALGGEITEDIKKQAGNTHRATLVISQAEALTGTSRTLDFPGANQVSVHVPAGVRDGQVIRLAVQGQPSDNGTTGTTDSLIISIAITPELDKVTPPLSRPIPRRKILLSAGLVLLVVLASIGLLAFIRNNQIAAENASATATARANITATSHALTTAANATAQANAAATATVQAGIATAASQADASATAAARAALATATALQNIYTQSTSGTPVLDDPLSDNSQGNQWTEINVVSQGGTCTFTGGVYHVTQSLPNMFYRCEATQTDLSNFAYQVQATILQGDESGIVFRFDKALRTFYAFHISTNGAYNLDIDNADGFISSLGSGHSPAIKTGLNQTNLITVVAKGHNLYLYVNKQYVIGVSDSTYSQGEIGVLAQDDSSSTDVAFSNAEAWKL